MFTDLSLPGRSGAELAGVTAGMSAVMVAAVWAELYGTRHLGAIRAMSVSIVALSPGLFGWLLWNEIPGVWTYAGAAVIIVPRTVWSSPIWLSRRLCACSPSWRRSWRCRPSL